MASVRFICGTQTQHTELERRLSGFLGTEATILFSSCFDANGGVFEALLDEQDAVISDELNHASIIDGIRLCKARRLRYRNRDMADLEEQLRAAQDARRRLVVTDGVFSMDGYLAPLDRDLRSRGAVRRDGDGRRLARGRLRRPRRWRHARPVRRPGPRRRQHRDAGQGARRRVRRVRQRPGRDRANCCGSAPGPTCSPTPSPRRSSPARSPPSTSSPAGEGRASSCRPTRPSSAR